MKTSLIRIIAILIIVGYNIDAKSQTFTLLKDINPSGNSNPKILAKNSGNIYFTADDGVHGVELWKSNGTLAGTTMVKDINPTGSSIPTYMIVYNNALYFSANDGTNGYELWKSDGTEAGTVLLMDINPGPGDSSPGNLFINNDVFYFLSTEPVHGRELWKSDGTAAGTALFKDFYPGTGNGLSTFGVDFGALGNTFFFKASDGPAEGIANEPGHGTELWKSDGTVAGTMMVKNINTVADPVHSTSSNPSAFIPINGKMLFDAQRYLDHEPWISDGTAAGTQMLKDIYTGSFGVIGAGVIGYSSDPKYFTPYNGQIFFSARDKAAGQELWKTDGTEAGTTMIKDIYTGTFTRPNGEGLVGNYSDPANLIVMGGYLYFSANNGSGRELWRTDGTEENTILVKVINAAGGSNAACLGAKTGQLFFSANDGTNGNELWVTDGTSGNTNLLQDFETGNGSSDPNSMYMANGKIFLTVTTSASGQELWVATDASQAPLPLTLLEFKGALSGNDGALQWKTDNESNLSSYTVERGTDGRNYSAIGNAIASNTSGTHIYNYTDVNIKSLNSSLVYYRLRQNDVDNKSTYSRIVVLSLSDKKNNFAMLYPNPVIKEINMTVTLTRREKLNWLLTDMNGRVIKNGFYDLSAGSTAVSIDMNALPSGHYIMQLKGESLQQSIKVVKQ